MISRMLFATAALVFSMTSVSAAPFFYECDLTAKGRSKGNIAEKMGISIDQNGQVIVIDGFIVHYEQDPMIAKVTKNTDQTLKFRWTLRDIRDAGNQLIGHMNSEAILDKKTNKVTVRTAPAKWPGNRSTGKGTCKVRTK